MAAIVQKSRIQIARIRRRLDFYGNASDWVPILTIQSLQHRIDQLLELEDSLNATLLRLQARDVSNTDKRLALSTMQTGFQKDLDHLISSAGKNLGQTDRMLTTLQNQVSSQQDVVRKLKSQFSADFHNETGCTPQGILNGAETILKVSVSVFKQSVEMGEAALKLEKAKSPIDEISNGIGFVKSVDSEFGALKDGYDQISTMISPKKPDFAKMFVDETKFDKMINQYTDKYASAAELKKAVHHYFELVQIRNEQVLNYNAAYLHEQHVDAEIKQREATVQSIAEQLAEKHDDKLGQYANYLQAEDNQNRLYLLSKIYEENKALEFWSLTDQDFQIDRNLSGLRNAHIHISQKIDDVRLKIGRPRSAFHDLRVEFHKDHFPSEFSLMEKIKKLTVSIPLDHPTFINKFDVIAEKVSVYLPGLDITKEARTLEVKIMHCGVGRFKRQDGTIKRFSHQPRETYFEWNYAQKEITVEGVLGDERQGYSGLSPFSVWVIDFSLPGNEHLDLSKLDTVELAFSGQLLGP